ncbi:hypothetical protein E2C01_089280 [Portunus trituberculatus]|uniref:Uncharacterized protein n=1 Tax=Portunus trituberculatus TaxID=210409 RepID=A0A5B7JM04_PORTR|nr:hypothetical protein [Portunus trituberculatus]
MDVMPRRSGGQQRVCSWRGQARAGVRRGKAGIRRGELEISHEGWLEAAGGKGEGLKRWREGCFGDEGKEGKGTRAVTVQWGPIQGG